MFRNLKEDVMTSAEMKSLIHERISGDITNQVIRMDVDAGESPRSLYLQSPPNSRRSGPIAWDTAQRTRCGQERRWQGLGRQGREGQGRREGPGGQGQRWRTRSRQR